MPQTIDPSMQRILAAMRLVPKVDLRALPIAEARATFIAQQTPWGWCPHPMEEVRQLSVGGMRARLYVPPGNAPRPVALYLHGGGWVFGDIDTHDGTMHWLAAASGCAVLGIDYRLAPEHPFPAAHEDALAATTFIRSGALGPACDATRVALAGDSAGANLALGALLAMRDAGQTLPDTACLFYGCYAPIFDTPSNAANGDGAFILSTEMMRWYWAQFLGALAPENAPPACAPLFADLAGLPPLYLNSAGLDPLLDDTTMLASRLAAAGVRYRLDAWPGVIHGFLRMARDLPMARSALIAAGAHLRECYGLPPFADTNR